MCGRYSFSISNQKLKKQFNIQLSLDIELDKSYNIAPSQKAYILFNETMDLEMMNWGLVPYWAKDKSGGHNLINARAEGITGRPSFRLPIRQKRCIVLADSFYEWKTIGRQKQPYRISFFNAAVIAMAGIWDAWIGPDNQIYKSFSIITTTPNEEMSKIHNRMPVILPLLSDQKRWLEHQELDGVVEQLKPLEDNVLNIYPISPKMSSPKYNERDIHDKIMINPTLFD